MWIQQKAGRKGLLAGLLILLACAGCCLLPFIAAGSATALLAGAGAFVSGAVGWALFAWLVAAGLVGWVALASYRRWRRKSGVNGAG